MTEGAIQQANDAFDRQVSAQVTRVTGELNRLEQLLSAGLVDRRVVAEFRDAVARVRRTSEHVKSWIDGDLHRLAAMLMEERIQTASQLANLLAFDLQASNERFSGTTLLKRSIQKLGRVLNDETP